MLTSWLRFPAPQGTGSGGEAGRVPQGRKALNGSLPGLTGFSSPCIDFSSARPTP
ncbi:uncharacterized protein METZ01_LOCUS214510, partial [marine metagenome]